MLPDPERPLVDALLARAAAEPHRPGLVEGEATHALGDLAARILGAADVLRARGVVAGDRVVIVAPNRVSVAVGYFASHALGAIAIPLGPDTPPATLRVVLEDAAPRAVLAGLPLPGVDALDLDAVAEARARHAAPPPPPRLDAAADLLFTTGTTGRPKGVLLTHHAVACAARNINAFVGAVPTDLEVVPIPLSHSFGLGRLRVWAAVGHRLALEPGLKNPAKLLKRLVTLRATGLALVPAGLALLRRLVKGRLADVAAHLRYVEIGSAPLGAEERAWLLEHLPDTRLCHHYGLTEASRAVFKELRTSPDHPRLVGRPTPGVELRVVDEAGAVVAPDAVGELEVRGGMVMSGYFAQPELTAERLVGGWLRTGDTGWVDASGWVYLLGRKGDLVNVGGLKVAPEEVEVELAAFPGVRDCACVGAPDPHGVTGEVVKAFVVVDGPFDPEAALAFLRPSLAEHQLPRAWAVVDAIPRTASGKVQRALLREGAAP